MLKFSNVFLTQAAAQEHSLSNIQSKNSDLNQRLSDHRLSKQDYNSDQTFSANFTLGAAEIEFWSIPPS